MVTQDATLSETVTLALRLRWQDTECQTVADTAEVVRVIEETAPDIVMFQPAAPDAELAETLAAIRVFSDVPVLAMSSNGSSVEAVQALDLGADDYFRTSSDMLELVARVVAVMRRAGKPAWKAAPSCLVSGPLTVDLDSYLVYLERRKVGLTSTEFRLLWFLMKHRGTTVSHHAIEFALWGDHGAEVDVVKKYVQRLRSKLGDTPHNPRWIASVRGVGYRFVGPAEGATAGAELVTTGISA